MNTPLQTNIYRRIWPYINRRRRLQLAVTAALLSLSALAEMVSIGAILPFLHAITDAEGLRLKLSAYSLLPNGWMSKITDFGSFSADCFAVLFCLPRHCVSQRFGLPHLLRNSLASTSVLRFLTKLYTSHTKSIPNEIVLKSLPPFLINQTTSPKESF